MRDVTYYRTAIAALLTMALVALALIIFLVPADAGSKPSAGSSSVPSPANAARAWPGPFAVSLVSVQDGDTVTVRFKEGPCGRGPCVNSVWSIRIVGVDTPESRLCKRWKALPTLLPTLSARERTRLQSCAHCPAERDAALKLKTYVGKLLGSRTIRVRDLKRDPYWGRMVGAIDVVGDAGEWLSLSEALLNTGLVEPYDPDVTGYAKLKPWCGG